MVSAVEPLASKLPWTWKELKYMLGIGWEEYLWAGFHILPPQHDLLDQQKSRGQPNQNKQSLCDFWRCYRDRGKPVWGCSTDRSRPRSRFPIDLAQHAASSTQIQSISVPVLHHRPVPLLDNGHAMRHTWPGILATLLSTRGGIAIFQPLSSVRMPEHGGDVPSGPPID